MKFNICLFQDLFTYNPEELRSRKEASLKGLDKILGELEGENLQIPQERLTATTFYVQDFSFLGGNPIRYKVSKEINTGHGLKIFIERYRNHLNGEGGFEFNGSGGFISSGLNPDKWINHIIA